MQLHTDRLFIRPIREADWPDLKRIVRDFDASPYAPYDCAFPESDSDLRAAAEAFAGSGSFYVAVLPETGEIIGYVSLWPNDGALSLGYCFHSAHHGHGYGYEACSALLDAYVQKGFRKFVCGTALLNKPSMRLIQKLGFIAESCEELSFRKDESGNDIRFTGVWFTKTIGQPK